jgi:radical SAM protein with 4Fe4S-binding SPASM domain
VNPLTPLFEAIRRDVAGFADALRPGVRTGLYTYRVSPPGGTRRIHLRIHPDGSGLLLVDVADAIHLNPTAAIAARLALDRRPPGLAVRRLMRRFRVADSAELDREVGRVYAMVDHLCRSTDACPTCGLSELERTPLFSSPAAAPYKADLALTYGCNNACRHCYNEPGRKAMPALPPDGWRRVLATLARVGVPHVIFTGGEPTLFDGLETLVAETDRLGLVAGMNTNGRRLAGPGFARRLAAAGLSHVQITLASCRPAVHDAASGRAAFGQTVAGIRNALAAGLHTITNTTLTRANADHVEEIVDFAASLGVTTMAANGMIHSGRGRSSPEAIDEAELGPILVRLRDRAGERGMRFLWYTPTPYCRLSPVELELGPRRCNAAEYSICVEPNGDVLPCQSYYVRAGNLLRDPWESIWQSPLFRSFRERLADPAASGLGAECRDCPDLPLCGGGCRLEREWHSSGCVSTHT